MIDLSKKQLKTLSEKRAKACVSIYIPTHKAGKKIEQNPIRLKNALKEARMILEKDGLPAAEINQLLNPAETLIDDYHYWQRQSEGLALFLAGGEMNDYRLPKDFKPLSVVSNRFHIKPLIPLLNEVGCYTILALSLGQVRLLQGTKHGIHEVELDGFPEGIQDALAYDDPERQLQHQTLTRTGGGQPAIFHGHGNNYDTQETIRRYLHKVDDQVSEILRDENAPLILACVDYLYPIYEQVNHYNHLLGDFIPGNPERASAEELQSEAWKIIAPIFEEGKRTAVENFHQLSGTSKVSDRLDEIVPAAYYERVDTLFAAIDVEKWGRFDPERHSLQFQDEKTTDNDDLLDFAAVHTIINGGKVFVMEAEEVPGRKEASAILRY